jgi:diketogulonate reductase-like aldo/keto reductase
MRSVSIAGTDLTTSRLGLGTGHLHHLVRRASRQNLLAAAWDEGFRYFDTAPLYGHELAERELGRFLLGRRPAAVLATKVGIVPNPVMCRLPWLMYAEKAIKVVARKASPRQSTSALPPRNYSPKYVVERVERSLHVLGTDYIDVLYLHEPTLDGIGNAEDVLAALGKLRDSGKIREFGLSGSFASCRSIGCKCPALTRVVQLEVHPHMRSAYLLDAQGHTPQITFGHVRNLRQSKLAGSVDGPELIRRALVHACSVNPTGVILLSTRSLVHARSAAATCESIEGSAWKAALTGMTRPTPTVSALHHAAGVPPAPSRAAERS